MTTNKNTPQPQPSCRSGIATALAALSLLFGVLSVIASTLVLPQLAWLAWLFGAPLFGAALLPGAIAALLPHSSRRTRIGALVGLALGVLSICLLVLLGPVYCNHHPSACA